MRWESCSGSERDARRGTLSLEKDAAGKWKPSQKKSIEQIDGIVALIIGIDRATTQPKYTSVYEKRGFIVIG